MSRRYGNFIGIRLKSCGLAALQRVAKIVQIRVARDDAKEADRERVEDCQAAIHRRFGISRTAYLSGGWLTGGGKGWAVTACAEAPVKVLNSTEDADLKSMSTFETDGHLRGPDAASTCSDMVRRNVVIYAFTS
jgi:hypothetical protein